MLAFNLFLPAYPLDGGRVLADLLLLCGLSPKVAGSVTFALGLLVSIAVLVYGFWMKSILTVAVAAYMLFSAFELLAYVVRGRAAQHPLFDYGGAAPTAPSSGANGGGWQGQPPPMSQPPAWPAPCVTPPWWRPPPSCVDPIRPAHAR